MNLLKSDVPYALKTRLFQQLLFKFLNPYEMVWSILVLENKIISTTAFQVSEPL